ncbi:MAG: DNA-directed polymerase subunit omega [Rickettsiales bacterium]|jgi:DNA-directed RNA polymerase subunit omega|nr:DNA-directed polymerase subunit omega [Rickettsiales bacterium]
MARVTVEDCIQNVSNRFELVAIASERAKNISAGSPITIDRDNDKNGVVALREIAARTVSIDNLREAIVTHNQRYAQTEEKPVDEDMRASEFSDEIKEFSHRGEMDDEDDLEDVDGISFDEDNLQVDD